MDSYKRKRQAVRKDIEDTLKKPPKKIAAAPIPERMWTMEQEEVAKLAPPGGSVWRARGRGGWMGHFPPFKRVQAMWEDFGVERAPIVLLQKLLHLHLIVEGLDESACPHKGMFAEKA